MTDNEVGQLFTRLKSKLSKKDLYDLFMVLDGNDEILYEFLGDLARKNFPADFEG